MSQSPLVHLSNMGRALDPADGSAPADSGVLSSIESAGNEVLDLFRGVDQSDIASGRVDITHLSREDKIELLVDGSTGSIGGGSPWSVALQLDASVAAQIHASSGGTLAFAISAGILDDLESKLRTVRYALVWDDAIVAERGNLDVGVFQSFLVVGLGDEPTGRVLTLWVTDGDIHATLVKQGAKKDLDTVRTALVGEIGAAAGKDDPGPFGVVSSAFNKVTGFITATQIGGIVALAAVGVVLIVIVRSNAAANLAKSVKVIV